MEQQNYKKHAKIDPLFHYGLVPLALVTLVLGIIQFVSTFLYDGISLSSLLLVMGAILFVLIIVKLRFYAIKLQDRLIRSEESFRYFVLTGKQVDTRVSTKQLIALRFASDEEFPSLVEKAINESLTPDQIKQSIENWRADYHRV